jgi:agmatinase
MGKACSDASSDLAVVCSDCVVYCVFALLLADTLGMPKSPRTILPDARVSPRFAGIPTFCRYPRLEDALKTSSPIDWAIYGVPFDGGVTYRPGARFGPRAVRMESQYVKRYSIEQDVDICAAMSIADAGDSPVAPYDCEENAKLQTAFAKGLGSKTTKLFAVGGDHTIAYGNMRATWEKRGKPKGGLALVHFDSHLDTVEAVWGERWGHGSVFRRAIEDGIVNPKKMISLGVKGPLNSKEDLRYAQEQGVRVVTYTDLVSGGDAELEAYVEERGGEETYVTFDIDCIDPAFAPGTGTPSVGGFTSSEALTLLRMLRGLNVCGADVVEVLPDRDPQGITALLAAHVMFEILCVDAAGRAGA